MRQDWNKIKPCPGSTLVCGQIEGAQDRLYLSRLPPTFHEPRERNIPSLTFIKESYSIALIGQNIATMSWKFVMCKFRRDIYSCFVRLAVSISCCTNNVVFMNWIGKRK